MNTGSKRSRRIGVGAECFLDVLSLLLQSNVVLRERVLAMHITEELTNLKKLESVGFTYEQSEDLADVIERA